MQPVRRDLIDPLATGIVRRSALSTAWKLTRGARIFAARTLPWCGCLLVSAGLLWLASELGRGALLAVLHVLVLPVVTAFTWSLVETMPDVGNEI